MLVHKQASRGTDEMLLSLTEVGARLQPDDLVQKLTFKDEEAELLNWDGGEVSARTSRRNASA